MSRGTTWLMSWPDGVRYLRPLQSLVVSLSLLTSRIHSCLFSDWRRTVSSKFFDTQVPSLFYRREREPVCQRTSMRQYRFPSIGFPPRNLCSLCPLSYTLQRTQPSYRFLTLYDWQNRESFVQLLWTLVPGHLSSHSALSSYGLFASLTLWRLSVSLRPLVQTLGSCPASWAPWSSAMPPSLGRGRENQNS